MSQNSMVIIRIWEGLGNQLFQYAYARALKKRGFDVRLDLNKTYDSTFEKYKNNDLRQNDIQNFNIILPEINVEKYGKYQYIKRDNIRNDLIFKLAEHGLWKYKFYEEKALNYSKKSQCIKGNFYVKGWFQDERYFRQIRKELLIELTPKKKIQLSKELRSILRYEESVSLHVRRGDYVRIRNALNTAYYKNAVAYMKKQYKNPVFLIFSDDLDWVKKNIKIDGDFICINENRTLKDYQELLIMSRCKSNIISNSTYSWWGAWLNHNLKKIVVAPQYGWRPGQKDIVPAEWIKI